MLKRGSSLWLRWVSVEGTVLPCAVWGVVRVDAVDGSHVRSGL